MTPSITTKNKTKTPLGFNAKLFAQKVLKEKKVTKGNFEFTFVTDAEILRINNAYLNHNYVTDIITFELSSKPMIEGDIYICVNEAKRNAKHYGETRENELKTLIIHGILHLLGYDDHKAKDKAKMHTEQARILKKLI